MQTERIGVHNIASIFEEMGFFSVKQRMEK